MPYKPLDERTVGLYSKNAVIQAAYIVFEKGSFNVERLIEFPHTSNIENSDDVKLLYKGPEEKELQELCNKYLAVASLDESDVLVRRLRMKLTRDKDIEEAFLFQTEPQLPYPIETAVVDKIIIEKSEGSTLLVFLAAKKDYIQKVLDFWQEHSIEPEVVSAEPIALNALLNACSTPEPIQYAVHIGKTATLSVLVKEGKLLAAHSVQTGWESLYLGLSQDRGESLSEHEIFSSEFNLLETEHYPHFKKALDELLQKILWNYLSLIKETKLKETPVLYVVGEGANVYHLPSLIGTTIGIDQGKLTNFNCSPSDFNRFSIPIGLSLTAQAKDNLAPLISVNFRREEYTYPTPWKRFKTPLLIYAALCLGVACSLYFLGTSYLKHKEDHLKSKFLELLSFTQKPYDIFEASYEQKYPFSKRGDTLIPIASLNAEDISNRIDFLETSLKSTPDSFPLLPNIPRVSDVLVWLSTHPKLVCSDNSVPGDCLPFTIDVFNYSLVKRPEINKKSEKYQVKIDLEFSTSSPRLAREFHDALITSNDFVDPKGEIKWTATKGKYRTSFFLKDKTIYP
jgi:type IV pilus assembly protein PilM